MEKPYLHIQSYTEDTSKIELSIIFGMSMIHQMGFRGASGVIEYVRPVDILAILYRLKSIGFKER